MDLYIYIMWFMKLWFKLCLNFLYARRKVILTIWKLPLIPLLNGINDTLNTDVMLERRCIKFIWTLLHYLNIIVKSVLRSAIRNGYSAFDENFRYHSYK